MAASKTLVFIPSINPNTWLLLTKLEDSTCLRDYSTSPCVENRSFSTTAIKELLQQNDGRSEQLSSFSGIPFSDEDFWREQIEFRNIESGLPEPTDEQRLQDEFKKQFYSARGQRNKSAALREVFERWRKRFSCVKDKKQFNHWDNDSAVSMCSHNKGVGWTSQLLEASRQKKKINYIPTGNVLTDFSLVAMELSLGISSHDNRFRSLSRGRRDFIKPDGLGVRKNGYFTIIEVKGPQDEKGLVAPMLQAACGALAVIAKRQMLCRIARKPTAMRPACPRAAIPLQSPSLGIHVLTQARKDGSPREAWSSDVDTACAAVLSAFGELQYIAYSFVTDEQAKNLNQVKTDVLLTKDGMVTP